MLQTISAYVCFGAGISLLFISAMVSVFINKSDLIWRHIVFILAQQVIALLMILTACYIKNW